MEKKSFTESDRTEVYSQAFNVELFGYGDVHWIHHWALFASNNDDICRSYSLKKTGNGKNLFLWAVNMHHNILCPKMLIRWKV